MSVATKNPFALLDDDEAPPSAPVTKQESAPPAPPAARGTAQKSRGGPAARGGKYYARGGKPQSKDAALVTDYPEGNKPAGEPRGDRGERRGRGRGGRGDSTRRGRPFDRHSQTGLTDSDKKIQQSWGGADGNTELENETAAKVDAAVESTNEWATDAGAAAADWAGAPTTSADAWAPTADAATPAPEGDAKPEGRPRREREPEEEDNTLTLDQYLAQQKEKDSLIPKLENTRKANEGADDNIWKDAVPLAKNEEEDAYFVGKSKSAPKARAKKEDKVYLEIEARFDRPDRGGRGRGRGDRGGEHRGDRSRGARGGRGGPRGGRQNGPSAPVVNVDDQADFPTLS